MRNRRRFASPLTPLGWLVAAIALTWVGVCLALTGAALRYLIMAGDCP